MRKLSVAKFGGSLLDPKGKSIPKVLERVRELKERGGAGPIVVFSAPGSFTDELIRIGESFTRSEYASVEHIFDSYEEMARAYVEGEPLKKLLSDLAFYRNEAREALSSINKRFQGNVKAKLLTSGGELPTSLLMEYIMTENGLESRRVPKDRWPIVTDDNFENASPLYEESLKRIGCVVDLLDGGKVVSQAGFLGVTVDGLETTLGRGGSDLTAVFLSCLLQSRYEVETLLFKDVPVQSADPQIVKGQRTFDVPSLTYNEAHKASMMGMKIVQDAAISMARRFKQPLKIVPMDDAEKCTVIRSESFTDEIVKVVTGKKGCAILSMRDERSRSLEDSLRIWESRSDFLDLGTETLETEERIRDFLFLDSGFLSKNEDKIKSFDANMKIEYGVGVVTLIGDRMKDSPGVASIAIGAIPRINIKRGVFAPHTSQIILVVEEKDVEAAVEAIHMRRSEMNKTR
ncbi:MAG: aspartate kinase [Candidatus Brockarchaeota archaeon]|nr:aspartate kinase [Candidatus Brockarchaeota archaeon]